LPALQADASVDDHVNVAGSVAEIVEGLTDIVAVGCANTVSGADAWPVPPGPTHVTTKVCVPEIWTVTSCEPAEDRVPVHAPEAVHAVEFVEDHVTDAFVPTGTPAGATATVTVGAGNTTSVRVR
jgi:hypothetical protein